MLTHYQEIEHYMDQGRLDSFNQALDAIYSQLAYRCEAWNLLNETQMPPSQRTPQGWIASPKAVDVCVGSQWDPDNVITCGWVDSSGSKYDGGLCDPNGHCYYTSVSYQVR